MKFNDLKEEKELVPGTVVYLQKKKKKAAAGLEKYVVEGSLDLRSISQRFAVRLDKLCKLNDITPDHVLRDGDVLNLR